MKYYSASAIFGSLFVIAQALNLPAQGTAFTYQGRLSNGGAPANGYFDITFASYNTNVGGTFLGIVTNPAVVISNGLFTTAVDFGGIPDGRPYWLELGVRTNGPGNFTPLFPRQQLTPAPYAMFANTASNLAGSLSVAQLSGTISSNNIGSGTITASMLSTGAALSNLAASGQSAVPSGGMILSSNYYDGNLINAGYFKLGRVDLAEAWEKRSSTAAPSVRGYHTAVWTGSEMIIWGGADNSNWLATGGRYNATANSWTPVNTNGAPAARYYHTAVWTGTEMIIWGGSSNTTYYASGARYNPANDTWTPLPSVGAPSARASSTAVWTGTEMIIWGGYSNTVYYGTGARYNPSSNSWTAVTNTGAPVGRASHSAVWSGTDMIIWSGYNGTNLFSGGMYNPATNSWQPVSTLFGPAETSGHTAVWTGGEMVVFGGYNGSVYVNNAISYRPLSNSWNQFTSLGAPVGRGSHTAVWAGTEMIVWGGVNFSGYVNDGARLSIQGSAGTSTSVTTNAAPVARYAHTAVWTGNDMLIFGGYGGSYFNDTYSYVPSRAVYLYRRP